MSDKNLSGEDEALLILEYLENERMSKTFLSFLDESQHLCQLRSKLYENYEKSQQADVNETNDEPNEFQIFFNMSKQIVSQSTNQCNNQQNDQIAYLLNKSSSDMTFDEDFLNELVSQTPPMDYQHHLPDTPVPSVLPSMVNNENDDFKSIEQLFAIEHNAPSQQQMIQPVSDASPSVTLTVPYTKCIVVTQDFLQTMYNQQSTITNNTNTNINHSYRPKRRRRRLKAGKENYYQQRKIMPRTSPDNR